MQATYLRNQMEVRSYQEAYCHWEGREEHHRQEVPSCLEDHRSLLEEGKEGVL